MNYKKYLYNEYNSSHKFKLKLFKLYHLVNNIFINMNEITFTHLLTFTPLPTKFVINDDRYFKNYNNIYLYKGNCIPAMMYADKILPTYKTSPIPFTFSYKYNNIKKTILSNVYYYEIKINDINNNDNNFHHVGIGFSQTLPNSNLLNLVGTLPTQIGYHSDGAIINETIVSYTNKYGDGDVIGAGIIYKNNLYTFFFTLNGLVINLNYSINNENVNLIPVISCNYHTNIIVNFGNDNFLFDVELLNTNDSFSQYNTFINDFDYTPYLFNPLCNCNIKYNCFHINTFIDNNKSIETNYLKYLNEKFIKSNNDIKYKFDLLSIMFDI